MCPIPAFAVQGTAFHSDRGDCAEDGQAEAGRALRRPRLLMSAARHGLRDYCRTRDLLRLLGYCPGAPEAVADLTEMEAAAEAARRAGNPAWSCTRHVEVLIALLAERALSGG